jgi:hypothetical protein
MLQTASTGGTDAADRHVQLIRDLSIRGLFGIEVQGQQELAATFIQRTQPVIEPLRQFPVFRVVNDPAKSFIPSDVSVWVNGLPAIPGQQTPSMSPGHGSQPRRQANSIGQSI